MTDVYLVEGKRTPQAKAQTNLKDIDAPFLGHYLIRYLADTHSIPTDKVDEVIIGCVGNPVDYPNVGRVMALEAGLHKKTSGVTVHRNCASGMEAMAQGFYKIKSGQYDVIFAGGVENMSQAPLLLDAHMQEFFFNLASAKSSTEKLKVLSSIPLSSLKPIISIERALTDPFCGLNMGQTAEKLARELDITREQQDEFANESHHRYFKAKEQGVWEDEILPIIAGTKTSEMLTEDIGPRAKSSMESLAKLKPFFERETGTVTVGNACPITDGGSMWLMCSEEAVKKYQLNPVAKMKEVQFSGLEPERMGLGPAVSTYDLLAKADFKFDDVELFEINEAFAAQVLACQKFLNSDELMAKYDMKRVGELTRDKLNVHGGAIAMGHPVGSTGSRLVVTLVNALKKQNKKYGVASLCIGGGQGGAMLVERL